MLKGYLRTLLIEYKLLVIVVFFGALSWSLTMLKSGMSTEWGLGFWGANGHDGIWHVALANSLARGSFQMPTYAGSELQNYHLGFDLLVALISKLGISTSAVYFQILPLILSVAIGVLTYCFVKSWKNSKSTAIWSVFFVYFSGGFGWVVTLIREGNIAGESMFWSQQSISTLINPPFALSLVLFLVGSVGLSRLLIDKSVAKKRWLFLTVVCLGVLIVVKAYLGVLVLSALLFTSLVCLLVKQFRKHFRNVSLIFIAAGVLSLLVFLPFNSGSGSLLIFQPFWFLETMLAISDRFGWPRLYEALINWRASGTYHKAIAGYLVAFLLFVLGNLGTRVLSIFSFNPRKPVFGVIDVFLLVIALGGLLLPTFFVQQGTAWNTIQFLYYTLFILAIYSGVAVSNIFKRMRSKSAKLLFAFCVVLLTIPTTLSTLLTVYLPPRPPAVLTHGENEALSFLSKMPQGTVLTYPFDSLKAKEAINNPPRPLYLYDSTSYVSAFSNKDVFLEDEVNLTIMGYPWKTRRESVEAFYKTNDQSIARAFLKDNNIRYIYWVNPQQRAVLGDLQLGLKNIFENKQVTIYEVLQ